MSADVPVASRTVLSRVAVQQRPCLIRQVICSSSARPSEDVAEIRQHGSRSRLQVSQGPGASVISRVSLDAALQSVADRRGLNLKKIRQMLDDTEVTRAAGGIADLTRLSRGLVVLDDRTLEHIAAESDNMRQQQARGKTGRFS